MFMGGFQMSPMMGMGLSPMMGMGMPMGVGGLYGIFIMMQMMQMWQMMMMLMGQMQQGGCGCGLPGMGLQMGNMMGLPGGATAPGLPWGGFNPGGGFTAPGLTNAPAVDLNSIRGGTPFGRSLAADAARNANGPGGWCYKWVANALRRHGVNVYGASAYMAADQLARNPKFQEVKIQPPSQLKNLPPGAVVVWDRGPGHPHGHISIAGGNGMEYSDLPRRQITNYGTSYRVFLPR